MSDALKNISSHQITLEDNSQFYYTIAPYELTNSLGNIIAILQEYNFERTGTFNGQFSGKLYKTKEGNWYDIDDLNIFSDKGIVRMLKSAIDAKEFNQVLK
jgi:hypothetical protein